MVLLTGANTRILQLAAIDEQIELCRHELAALLAGVDAELAKCVLRVDNSDDSD